MPAKGLKPLAYLKMKQARIDTLGPNPKNDTLFKGKTKTKNNLNGQLYFVSVTLEGNGVFSCSRSFAFRLAWYL